MADLFYFFHGHRSPSTRGRGGPLSGDMGSMLLTVCPLPSLSSGGVDPLPNIRSWSDFLSSSVLGADIVIASLTIPIVQAWYRKPWEWVNQPKVALAKGQSG